MSSNDIVQIWLREWIERFYVFQSNPKENVNPWVLLRYKIFHSNLYFGRYTFSKYWLFKHKIPLFLERKVGQQAAHWLLVMPGVQNKYSIDVINRFAIEDDDVEDEDAENIDPFEELKALNQKAEDAKNAPKPKVIIWF